MQFSCVFIKQFIVEQSFRKNFACLIKVEQGKGESIGKFGERFNKELLETECDARFVIAEMTNGIREEKFVTLLYTQLLITVRELMARLEMFMIVEELIQ